MLHEMKEPYPALNYIWVGPPPELPDGLPGHDIAGPIRMAQANQYNQVVFWCLKEHLASYTTKLNKYGIKVQAIEDLLESSLKNLSAPVQTNAREFKEIFDTSLSAKRNKIRDRVTVKNAFSLFLLNTQGGYVLDTNVKPTIDKGLPPYPALQHFLLPLDQNDQHAECWMLYSQAQTERSQFSFSNYIKKWRAMEQKYKDQLDNVSKYPEEFLRRSGEIILESIHVHNDTSSGFFYFDYDENCCATVEEFYLNKYYYNTHWMTSETPLLLTMLKIAIDYLDTTELQELLTYSESASTTDKQVSLLQKIKNEALQYAAKEGQPACMDILEKFGAGIAPAGAPTAEETKSETQHVHVAAKKQH